MNEDTNYYGPSAARAHGRPGREIQPSSIDGRTLATGHRLEVERSYRRRHAQRLSNHDFIDSSGYVLEVVALHHGRHATRDFDVFDPAPQFRLCFSKVLPFSRVVRQAI
jgi:hypothetical protein